MEQRYTTRPYLSYQSGEVDKFLRQQRLPSPYRRPIAYKYPNEQLDLKPSTTNNYPPSSANVRPSIGYSRDISNNYLNSPSATSSLKKDFLERRRPGGRPPLHNSIPTTNSSYDFRRWDDDRKQSIDRQLHEGQFEQQQSERIVPIQTEQHEKHLGFSNSSSKRDYSAGSINKRFCSTQNLNGRLPSSTDLTFHRRSNSISSSGLPRRQSISIWTAPDRPLPAPPNDVTSPSTAIDGELQCSLPKAKQSEPPPPFDDLMNRFSNLSADQKPESRLSSASLHRSPIKSTQYSAPTTSTPLPLPPKPSVHRPIQNLTNSYKGSTFDREGVNGETNGEMFNGNGISDPGIPCLKGLANHGQSCYLASIIQCLASCNQFAKYLICNGPAETTKTDVDQPALLSNGLSSLLRALWFNHSSADNLCYKLLQMITKTNPLFKMSQQQDASECLIWLLDRLHDEIKESESRTDLLNNNAQNNVISHRVHKSEGELALENMERVSGVNRSTVTDQFRGQFRSALECTNPVCGFTNLTFDPYLTVSLTVPLPKRPSELSVVFVPFFGPRRPYHIQLAEPVFTIWDIKQRVMHQIQGATDQIIACQIAKNGQCNFLSDEVQIEERTKEITLLEIPKLNEQQLMQELVVAVVVFVVGIVPDGEKYGVPFVTVLNRQWGYDRISSFILEKGSFLLPRAFCPLPSDFTLLIQYSADQVACLDPGMVMPLFHDCINKVLSKENFASENVLKLIVEWSASVRQEFQQSPPEFSRSHFQNNNYASHRQDEIAIPLTKLLDDFVKFENIKDWKCTKCGKSQGRRELMFHSLPNVLIFHLKRFELLQDGITNKIESRVQVPLEGLDMRDYLFNPDVRANTLPRQRRDRHEYFQENSMSYDLIGVVNHSGQRTNSGHYIATCRNPIDGLWRTFDDSKVSRPVGPADIRVSTTSYLLFYERRSDNRNISSTWFPSAVPKDILAKYTEGSKLSNGFGLTRAGSSKFYTSTLDDNLPAPRMPPVAARSSSLQPPSNRNLPLTTNGTFVTSNRPSVYTPSRLISPSYSVYPRSSSSRFLDYPRYSSAYKF